MSFRTTLASVLMLSVIGLSGYLGHVAWRAMQALPERTTVERVADQATDELALARIRTLARGSRAPSDGGSGDGNVRYVDGNGIVAARVDGELVREPHKVAYGPPVAARRTADEYNLVVIESAGTIDARSRRIKLSHVKAPESDLECTTSAGVSWPCGRRARTAMRRLVRRRAIQCLDERLEQGEDGDVHVARCSVGGVDLSKWLVENGWAVPTESAPDDFTTAHLTAQNLGRGLYNSNAR